MSQAHFSLTYDGEAVRDGELDATDLASAILALAQAVKATGKIVIGPEADVTLKVRTLQAGSFEILMNAVAHGDVGLVWGIIKQFYASSDGQTAKAVVDTLVSGGTVVGVPAAGLIQFLKWRRGRAIEKIDQLGDGAARVVINGDVIVVAPGVLEAARNPVVRAGLQKVVADPLERDGIDIVRFSNEKEAVTIKQGEAEFFRDVGKSDAEFESTYTKVFSIVSLSFKPGNKWKLHDGQAPRSVTILDEDFIARIDSGAERFAKGDLLICQVREVASQSGKSFKSQYEVLRVLDHRPFEPPEQLPI